MTTETDIYRAANLLIQQHGDDAPIHAAMRADELLEAGDLDGIHFFREDSMNDETIKQLISRMDALSTRVESLESEVRHLESEVKSLSSRCRQFQQDIEDLQ